jgi:hypothetical protein
MAALAVGAANARLRIGARIHRLELDNMVPSSRAAKAISELRIGWRLRHHTLLRLGGEHWPIVVNTRPSQFVLDEVGYYTVQGLAVLAAQARSLGFSLVFATQDIPAMLRNDDKEAKSMIANTTTKIFMRVEETEMTAKLAVDSAGKGNFARVSGFAANSGEFATPYLDNMEARFEEQERVTVRNLRALGVGEAYVTWRDSVFKVKTFHAHPEGEYGADLKRLALRANHFLAFSKPTKEEVKKIGILVDVAERLDDPRFARIIENRAREERLAVTKMVNERRDPTNLRNEIAAGSVAFLRAAYRDGKRASSTDLVTAGAVAIAAICQAMQKQGDQFAREVRAAEGLPAGGLVQSGRARAPSLVPGMVNPAARVPSSAGVKLPPVFEAFRPKMSTSLPPPDGFAEDIDDVPPEPEDEAEENQTAHLASALESLGSPEARREAAQSQAPSRMKDVAHGVTVDNVAYDMANKMQTNETTLHFLAALDFEGEPGEEEVDAALNEAANAGAEDLSPQPKPPVSVTAADLERADVASARAAQWVERADDATSGPAPTEPEAFEKHLEQGNVEGMTQAFLAELLEQD